MIKFISIISIIFYACVIRDNPVYWKQHDTPMLADGVKAMDIYMDNRYGKRFLREVAYSGKGW